jgi:hypothetical protein
MQRAVDGLKLAALCDVPLGEMRMREGETGKRREKN